jgi:chromosomal replication initiator protein
MAIENLNPLYTFQTFWVVSFNQFAHAAALAVAENPGNSYNPLYIYGGDSETRTHLLHAIGHAVGERDRQARIVYISAKHLTYEPNDASSQSI